MNYFSEATKPMYEYNFNLLSDHLPEMVNGVKTITLVKIENGEAGYNMVGTQNGQDFSFHLLFDNKPDGIWRIKFF